MSELETIYQLEGFPTKQKSPFAVWSSWGLCNTMECAEKFRDEEIEKGDLMANVSGESRKNSIEPVSVRVS